MNNVHWSLFSSWLSSPDENFPEQHLLSSSSDVFSILKSFMKFMAIENFKDIFFNSGQKFVEIIMTKFSRVDHSNQYFMFNSE